MTKNRKAHILPHCLSTKKQVEVVIFDIPQSPFSSGITVNENSWTFWPFNTERRIQVQCFSLYSVLKALNNPHVDYFSLDIEGAEAVVLKTLPWNEINITLFTIEINHAGETFPGSKEEIRHFMKKNGYEHLETVVIDDIFYKEKLNRFS